MINKLSVKDILTLPLRKIYIYVPPCPSCGSRVTGKLTKKPITDGFYVMKETLKAGELVRFTSSRTSDNCYCETCGHTWYKHLDMKLWTRERINEEREIRKTEEKLAVFLSNANKKVRVSPETEHNVIEDSSDKITILYIDRELIRKTIEIQGETE